MRVPIVVKAVCALTVLQLIVCYNIINWECRILGLGQFFGKTGCKFQSYSQTRELNVTCLNNDSLTYNKSIVLKEPFILNQTEFPSLKEMWDQCKSSGSVPDLEVDMFARITVTWVNVGLMTLPDDFFCHWTNITTIYIDDDFLTDSTKLGFKSIQECQTQCITNISHFRIIASDFTKISNDSFCGLDRLIGLEMPHGDVTEVESDAFVHLTSLQLLNLEDNYISILRPGAFRKQKQLQFLDLSMNYLNSSSIEQLRNLEQLQFLMLNDNEIDALPEGIFNGMKQLESLWMQKNLLTTLQGALSTLTNIKTLSISSNNISVINSEDFEHLINLDFIDLHNNPVIHFEPRAFNNCTKLTTIIITHAVQSTVPQFIFKARNLKILHMSQNNINEIQVGTFDEGEDIALIDMASNNITQVTNVFTNCTVKHLILDDNRLTKLSFTDFSFKLIELSITHNHIHTIDSGTHLMSQKWALKYLNLSYNHLKTLTNLNLPQSVTTFDVQNNTIQHMCYSQDYTQLMLEGSTDLTQIYLQNNAFKVICPSLISSKTPLESYFNGNPLLCSCENLWISKPLKQKYFKKSIVADLDTLTCKHQFQRLGKHKQSIKTLAESDFLCSSNNSCSCNNATNNQSYHVDTCNLQCPTQCTCYNKVDKSIIHIDCSSNNVTILPLTPITDYSNAHKIYVYLDNNLIFKIPSNSFIRLNNTIELYLNQTYITEMEDGSFDHLTILKVLNLANNNLKHLSEKIFKRLSSLTQLFLSHNKLQSVEPNAFPSQLQTLYLDNNLLVNYSFWQLQNLVQLNLQGNKWSCDCQFIEKLRNWLLKFSDGLTMLETLFCVLPSGKELHMPLINLTSEHCHNATAVNILISDNAEVWMWVLGFFTCLTIISITVFYFRREAQVLIYSRLGVRLFYRGEKDELEGKYFDVFIAYSCVDEDFLVNDLMPGLERIDEPYKLCLHHRNFLGGASIMHSIMEAVQFSTRTIILLSDNFMRSEWCRFEFQQAYIQMLKDRCNRLLVIIIDEVPTNLDPEMRVYLRTNTYLKWGDKLFWKKLYFTLPERLEPRLAQRRLRAQPRVPHEDRVSPEELPMQIME